MKDPTQSLTKTSSPEVTTLLEVTQRTIDRLDQGIIDAMIDCLLGVWRRQGTVYTMGNGGSTSTASHFAADLAKYTIAEGKPRFKVLALTDNAALISAWTNDEGFSSIFAEQMAAWIEAGDALVGFSVHGGSGTGGAGPWSQNMVRAMQLAKDSGA